MTVLDRLENWRASGAITQEQYSTIASLVRGDRFSLFVELNVLLYLGVVFCIAGLGWTVKTHFENLGDAAILFTLTVLCGGSFYYCFSRVPPYSRHRTESPSLAFDYVLYLGALAFAVELGYIEFRFQLLQQSWDHYVLLSAVFYFFLAYRFDNRFVLSLALSTLAAWFGLSFTRFGILRPGAYRVPAILYAAVSASAGAALWAKGVKPHFLRTYLHLAANVLFVTLVSGAMQGRGLYLLAVLALSAIAIYGGFRFGEFAFAGYGTIYGYIGLSAWVLRSVDDGTAALVYFLLSGTAVLAFIAWLALKAGQKK